MARMVKRLILVNVLVYITEVILMIADSGSRPGNSLSWFIDTFGLRASAVTYRWQIWQVFTYQFLHSPGSILHILFNMLALWMFGSELEARWGSRTFFRYYTVCAVGAGLFITLVHLLAGEPGSPTIGASGAIFGLLLAYAVYWPDRYILFLFFIPIKVKYFVLGIGLVSLLFTIENDKNSAISHVGHLGGLVSGYLYILYRLQSGPDFFARLNLLQRYRLWKKKREWAAREAALYESMHWEEKLDAILEKISRQGMKSLNAREREFLRKASETMDNNAVTKPGNRSNSDRSS